MRPPATSMNAINKVLRRFRRNRRGSAAIEFAFVAPIFFGLLFAIIETALMFFAAQVLETGTQDAARLVLTHQAQDANMSQKDFATNLCNRVNMLFDCTKITISVKAYAPNTAIPAADLASPISGGVFSGQSAYETSKPGDTVVVRAFYQWPIIVTQLGYNIANLGRTTSDPTDKRLLAATSAFRVEP